MFSFSDTTINLKLPLYFDSSVTYFIIFKTVTTKDQGLILSQKTNNAKIEQQSNMTSI